MAGGAARHQHGARHLAQAAVGVVGGGHLIDRGLVLGVVLVDDLEAVGGRNGQCFGLYAYSDDGSQRVENITDWSLAEFRDHYADKVITKRDICQSLLPKFRL